jgi:radical SAM protein with 4Fe4S-binding SPASM domain
MIFTGRVFPIDKKELAVKKTVKDRLKCKGKELILISAGGGIDGVDIIEKLITIKDAIDKKFNSFYLISTGPSIEKDNFKKLHGLIENKKDIIIKKFIPGYPNYINAADLYISMGGYNSINNALFTGAKAIIFPRQSDSEQKLRTKYFSHFLNIGNYKDSKNNLASKIINVVSKKKRNIEYKGNFKGAEVTARLIERILNLNYIKIRLTTKCNLHCDMCSVKHQRRELDFLKVKQIIDQAKILNIKSINFTGGEPTLYFQFYNLIRYAKKQGFFVSVSTNGIIKDCGIAYLSKYCDYIDISINSHKEELDDKIRSKRGAFNNSFNFIKQLNYLNSNIWLHMNVTIRPDNYENIHRLVPLLARYINSVSFTLVDTSINKLSYLKFRKDQLLSFYFNEAPLILKECIKNKVKLRITPFFMGLQNLNNRERLKRLLTNKKYYFSNLESIFEINSTSLCQRARSDLRVNANGWVCPCCYLDDYPINLGNINDNSLLEIVSSNEYFNFIASARPNRGWCEKCAIGYKIYAKFFK